MTRCCFRKYLTFYLSLLAVESFSFLELPSLYSYPRRRSDSRRTTSYYYKSIGTTGSSGSTTTSNSISYNKLGALSLSKKQTQQQEENVQYARKISAPPPPKRRTRSSNQQQQQSSSTRTASKSTIQQKTTVVEDQHQVRIRLNKVFKETHSRRQADDLIASGRVTVNGKPVVNKGGFMVVPYRDVIAVDGKVVKGWETMNGFDVPSEAAPGRNGGGTANSFTSSNQQSTPQESFVGNNVKTEQFEYVKYFKPLGVTCTTDERIRENIIYAIKRDGYVPRHRVFPVGRLDKETTGLIILTSDGRLVNSVLRGEMKQPKVYKVMVDGRLNDKHLERLRNGVTITTVAQRKGKTIQENTLVAKTKPCLVERLGPCSCKMTLMEGRNRQIRKMMEALGFTVVKLHRVEFMGIYLGGGAGAGRDSANGTSKNGLLRPGDWAYLDASEMDLVKKALQRSSLSQVSTQDASLDEKEEEQQ